MGTVFEKKFLHDLHEQYYGDKNKAKDLILDAENKGHCVICQKRRKLCKKGPKKGQCKNCRSEG